MFKGFASDKTKIVVYDLVKKLKKIYKSTKDVADELDISQPYINTIIQRDSLLKKRYKIERILSEEKISNTWEEIY